jgi:hypothetical protein
VSIPSLGKVQVEFPKYSAKDTPIQFHLPVVCAHHLNKKVAPNCAIVAPDPLHVSEVRATESAPLFRSLVLLLFALLASFSS